MKARPCRTASIQLGGQTIFVHNGTAAFADGTLAGSVLTMKQAFSNLRRFTGVSLPDAARLSSGNAARQIGVSERLGEIAPGKTADLVILDPETGEVEWTLVGGQVALPKIGAVRLRAAAICRSGAAVPCPD